MVRHRLAGQPFTDQTYEEMMELADALFDEDKAGTASSIQVAATKAKTPNLDETQPALQYPVAAIRGNGRGRGRGNRGGRGRGQPPASGNSKPETKEENKSRWPTPRHADSPPIQSCFNHHTYGRSAFFCSDPLECKWAKIPPNPRQKPVDK